MTDVKNKLKSLRMFKMKSAHRRNQKRNQNMHRNEWKWKHNNPKPMGHCKSSAEWKIHSITGLPQETRKKSNK